MGFEDVNKTKENGTIKEVKITKTINETQGIIHEPTLHWFFNKKFNRCPERYFMNTAFLGLYLLLATVLLVNLLVALFATTYENVQENSEKIWKLNRYDLIIDYWGKTPWPPPLVLIEHMFLFFKMILFCGKDDQVHAVCWPRSPGDHALAIDQFPIVGYNIDQDNKSTVDDLIKEYLLFESKALKKVMEEEEEEEDAMDGIDEKLGELSEDIRQLHGTICHTLA